MTRPLLFSALSLLFSHAAAGPCQGTPETNLKCIVLGHTYVNGERYTEGNFMYQCNSCPSRADTEVVGCLTPLKKLINVGEQIEEGVMLYQCLKNDVGVILDSRLARPGCKGGKHPVGQEFLSDDKRFVFKCLDEAGNANIISCKTNDGQAVAVGTEQVIGEYKHKCFQEENGYVSYSAESLEKAKCEGKYEHGQRFNKGKFVYYCNATHSETQTTAVACLTPAGKEIYAGGAVEEGDLIFKCDSAVDGNMHLESDLARPGCKDGKVAVGETFLGGKGDFVFKCMDKLGSADIIACRTPAGEDVPVDTEPIIAGVKHSCIRNADRSVSYAPRSVNCNVCP